MSGTTIYYSLPFLSNILKLQQQKMRYFQSLFCSDCRKPFLTLFICLLCPSMHSVPYTVASVDTHTYIQHTLATHCAEISRGWRKQRAEVKSSPNGVPMGFESKRRRHDCTQSGTNSWHTRHLVAAPRRHSRRAFVALL